MNISNSFCLKRRVFYTVFFLLRELSHWISLSTSSNGSSKEFRPGQFAPENGWLEDDPFLSFWGV